MGHLEVQGGEEGAGVEAPVRGVRVGPAPVLQTGGVEEVAAGGHQGRAGGRGKGARRPGGWGQGAPAQGAHHLQGVGQGVVEVQEEVAEVQKEDMWWYRRKRVDGGWWRYRRDVRGW